MPKSDKPGDFDVKSVESGSQVTRATSFFSPPLFEDLPSSVSSHFPNFFKPNINIKFFNNPKSKTPFSTQILMRIQASPFISTKPIPPHSSISTSASSDNNLTSSKPNHPSLIDPQTRCEGLDLLVKAAIHVAGETFFSRKRKKPLKFTEMVAIESREINGVKEEKKKGEEKKRIELISSSPKKCKRVMGLPSKYNDSVIQPWKVKTRRPR